jgi:GTP cyclohydrolase IA
VSKSNRRDGTRGNGRKSSRATATKETKGRVATRPVARGRRSLVEPLELIVEGPAHIVDRERLAGDSEDEFEALVRRQLELLGEDPDRAGLVRTPDRVARSMAWLTRGYRQDAWEAVGEGVFEEAHDHMVMVRDIELYSMCEHHLLPFFGKAHIAYIPAGRILGLSKLPRIVEVFARRLQVQERLTAQIAQAVEDVLEPRGVGVVIEAMHLCMMMRGVEKQNSKTITSALLGSFRDDGKTRDEFLRLAHGRD